MVADGRTHWDGVRNHSAKLNLMAMKVGERGFFYHSGSTKEIVGIAARSALTYAEMESLPKERAVINRELCTDCQRCLRSCFYNAMTTKEGQVNIGEECRGCGICTCVCPVPGAVALQQYP